MDFLYVIGSNFELYLQQEKYLKCKLKYFNASKNYLQHLFFKAQILSDEVLKCKVDASINKAIQDSDRTFNVSLSFQGQEISLLAADKTYTQI